MVWLPGHLAAACLVGVVDRGNIFREADFLSLEAQEGSVEALDGGETLTVSPLVSGPVCAGVPGAP